jgi:hypothetical protein
MATYSIHENGDIISGYNGKPLSQHVDKKGYCRVTLKSVGTRLVHRLVAEAFIPNPDNLPQVNHLDGNKSNNHVSNLEWATGKKNVEHSVKIGLVKRGDQRPNAAFSDDNVRECRRLRELGWNYYELGARYNVSYQTVHKICTRQTYTHIE